MPIDTTQIITPCIFLPSIIASISCLIHAHARMPKTWYSTGLQTAFALGILVELLGAGHYATLHTTDTATIPNTFIFIYNNVFIWYAAVYCFAQTEFLRSFIPVNELRVGMTVLVTRLFVVATTVIATITYDTFALTRREDKTLKNVSFACTATSLFFDVVVNMVVVKLALKQFRQARRRVRWTLVGVWFISLVDFVLAVAITFGPGRVDDVWNATGDMFATLYIQLSYLCIVVIRRMLVVQTAREFGSPTEGATVVCVMPAASVASQDKLSSCAPSIPSHHLPGVVSTIMFSHGMQDRPLY